MKVKNSTRVNNPNEIPPEILKIVTQYIMGTHEENMDFKKPYVRKTVKEFVPFIVAVYGIIVVIGIISNLGMLVYIIKKKMYKDPTYSMLINNAISDIMKCSFVLPISLYVLLVKNWMLGEVLCSFLPMFQDIPLHVTMLSHLIIAWDRYRYIHNPNGMRISAFVCGFGSWLTAICLVLPYPIYIMYVDLGKYLSTFEGVGICIINLTDDMQEYMRGIFVLLYALPLCTISYFYIKTNRELKRTTTFVMYETRHRGSRARTDSHSTSTDIRGFHGDCESEYSRRSSRENRRQSENVIGETEMKEKTANKYLANMVVAFAVCLFPLMVLRLARLAISETYANAGHFDIIYTTFVWIGFLPTCITPFLFLLWQMPKTTKKRLANLFRYKKEDLGASCETVQSGHSSAQHCRNQNYMQTMQDVPLTHLCSEQVCHNELS